MKFFKLSLMIALLFTFSGQVNAIATHPLGALKYEYSGRVNSLSIGGSLRTAQDAIPYVALDTNACLVGLTSSDTLGQAVRDPANVAIAGLPAGATILAAHLYWAGSYSPTDPASTALVPDYNVLLNGIPVAAPPSNQMTDLFVHTWPLNPTNYDFFGGHADVTSIVAATGNGTYTFGGLTVNTAGNHCSVYGVLAGWALHVIYQHPAEPFRVVKIYDGFQIYKDASIQLTPNGFTVPGIPKGKLIVTTWEGDEGNSTAGATFTENLKINVLPSLLPNFVLSSILNPAVDPATGLPNQFNGTKNTTNPTSPIAPGAAPAPYGVDIDHYDISAQLSTGQTSLATEYSSGADLVILSSEIMTLENDLFADLSISKTHIGDFGVGIPNHYTISVNNNGPIAETGPIIVTDTLPAGLNYVSATGAGWTCSYAGTLNCSHLGPLNVGATLPPITLTVTAPAVAVVTNTATVSGALTDNIILNNSSSDITNIINPPILTVMKMASAPSATPGTPITYSIQVTNTGTGAATSVNQTDNLSQYTAFGVECMGLGISIAYADGAPASTLVKGTPVFYKNGVVYVPPSLGSGVCTFDPNITSFSLPMVGSMPPTGTYSLQYQVQVK